MTNDLVSGVISSLLVVVMVELYLRLRKRWSLRALRRTLGTPREVTIVAPVFPADVGRSVVSLMGTYDAYAMAHILAAYRRIGVEPSITSVRSTADGLGGDVLCIGGTFVNALTKAHLDRFCPGFQLLDPGGRDVLGVYAYRSGAHEFLDTEEQSWAFIVKLTPELTGRLHTTVLVWGLGAVATAAAGYVLANLNDKLPSTGGRSFFAAIPVERAMGYRGVSTQIVDVSAEAFAAPASGEPSASARTATPGDGDPAATPQR